MTIHQQILVDGADGVHSVVAQRGRSVPSDSPGSVVPHAGRRPLTHAIEKVSLAF